jgi:hypothetical protein
VRGGEIKLHHYYYKMGLNQLSLTQTYALMIP